MIYGRRIVLQEIYTLTLSTLLKVTESTTITKNLITFGVSFLIIRTNEKNENKPLIRNKGQLDVGLLLLKDTL